MSPELEELIAKWECRRRAVCRDIDRINFDKLEGQEILKAKMESSKAAFDEFIADLKKEVECTD